MDFLTRQNVVSGDALKHATQMLEGKRRIEIIRDSIPDAWNKIVSEPDGLLLDLLAERTNKVSGFQPSKDDLTEFFNKNGSNFLVSPEDESIETPLASVASDHPTISRTVKREYIPIAESEKLSAAELTYEIVKALQSFGGRAQKEQVEQFIYNRYEKTFKEPYYINNQCLGDYLNGNIILHGQKRMLKS